MIKTFDMQAPRQRSSSASLASWSARLARPPLLACLAVSACSQRGPLGPADSYLVYEPAPAGDTQPAASPALPLLSPVALDDPRARPLHSAALDGFVGEMLRTDYLAKQLLRDGWGGHAFSAAARARAVEPTVLVLAGNRTALATDARVGAGFATSGTFGRR